MFAEAGIYSDFFLVIVVLCRKKVVMQKKLMYNKKVFNYIGKTKITAIKGLWYENALPETTNLYFICERILLSLFLMSIFFDGNIMAI